ncbi:hypothetical protein ACRALDRAFT_2058709, partial [Sodiomyces alcalophilus JCM 7366]|uniref:uncharacterized protein n=1 Tax=Sodiomyces alcalophilus JCM 7366 TaxID=591952 RepID=UPI0039B606C2
MRGCAGGECASLGMPRHGTTVHNSILPRSLECQGFGSPTLACHSHPKPLSLEEFRGSQESSGYAPYSYEANPAAWFHRSYPRLFTPSAEPSRALYR